MGERWLITGASGQLGGHVLRLLFGTGRPPAETTPVGGMAVLALAGRGAVRSPGGEVRRVDLADLDALRATVCDFRPTHVLHLGAMTGVADAFSRPDEARRINTEATCVLAEATMSVGRAGFQPARGTGPMPAVPRFVLASTDMVFDGNAAPYSESATPAPLSHYGRTKAAAERAVLDRRWPGALVVRIPLLYGQPCSARETTFVRQIATLRAGGELRLFTDEFRTPLWLGDAARALIALARSTLEGMIHVAGPERLSRYELIERCARLLGIGQPRLVATSRRDAPGDEPRPADLSLDGSRFAREFSDLAPGPVRAEVLMEQGG